MASKLKIVHTSGRLLPLPLPHPSTRARTPAHSGVAATLAIGTQSQLQRPRPGKAGDSSPPVGPQERKAHDFSHGTNCLPGGLSVFSKRK